MRYALVSDVHANLEALVAVLAAIDEQDADRVVCLGDHVGYHADPGPCIDLLRARAEIAVAGNHDRVAAGLVEPTRFGKTARHAILWTREALSEEHRRYLAELPLSAKVGERILAFHAALHPTPNADVYLNQADRVKKTLDALAADETGAEIGLFGHTHHPVVYTRRRGRLVALRGPVVALSPGAHYLVNPGSVGQSRDRDPRASFAILDDRAGTVRFHRVDYDRDACRAKAARAGLLPAARTEDVDRALLAAWLGRGVGALQRRLR